MPPMRRVGCPGWRLWSMKAGASSDFFFFFFGHCTWHAWGILIPQPGIEPVPLHSVCRVLTTAPLGESPRTYFGRWSHLWWPCCWSRWGRNFHQWLAGCVQFLWGWNTLFTLTQGMVRKGNKPQVHPEWPLEAVLGHLLWMWLGTVMKDLFT